MFNLPASNSRKAISDSNPAVPPASTSACKTSLALGLSRNRAKGGKPSPHCRIVAVHQPATFFQLG